MDTARVLTSSSDESIAPWGTLTDDRQLDGLQRAAFDYFVQAMNPANGLVADTSRQDSPFKGAYSFTSRFEEGAGTNPEELLAAAHASCFAMALSLILGKAGFRPDYVDATANVTIMQQGGSFRITRSNLVCEAKVPGIDQAAFVQHAESARVNCPVSQALAGTEITLEAKLVV